MTDLPHGRKALTTGRSSQTYGARTLLEEVFEGKPLSPREVEILQLASEGDSAIETAKSMYLAYETVKCYRKRIVAKLAARNITHAVTIGLKTHLIH